MDRVSEKKVTIRKARKCFGCLRIINRGETANIQTNSEDGKIYNITICEKCQVIVSGSTSGFEFSEGELAETGGQ